jgi:UDP-N-acetylglucosamine--N-acetylmuramyl-(pentapeptide) pyrophosphoryl-undecaprenol N-acetylglucosamine transferase
MIRVLICAGGTGGGIYPALAAATELQKMGLDPAQLLWVGTKGEMEETLVAEAGLRLETLQGGAIAGVPLPVKAINGAKLLWSVGKALQIVRRFRPDVMFMTGGYMAVPVTVASWLRRLPITIYLPDVEPGQSIRFALRFARKIAATTPGSAAYVPADRLVVTGYPVRPALRAAAALSQAEALAQFELQPGRPTLFVFGGSRGAQAINQALMGILPQLLGRYQVIHVSGTLTWPEVEANLPALTAVQRRYYRPFPYLHDEMGPAFRAADLAIARAGASMMGECPAFGLPAILVPLTFAWRYQKINANFLTERGAAVQLTDERLVPDLLPAIDNLLSDPTRLAAMSQAAAALDIPDGAANLARLIVQVAQSGERSA